MSFVQPSPIFPGSHAESHVEKQESQKADQKKLAATEEKIQEATRVAETKVKELVKEFRTLTSKDISKLKSDLQKAFQLVDKQANDVIRNAIQVEKPAPPGAKEALASLETPEQGKDPSQAARQKSEADSSKPQSGSTDPSKSASAQYNDMVRGTKPVAQPQQTPQAKTQTDQNQQPQSQTSQQIPQQPQQTPQPPQLATAQPFLKAQPGQPEQSAGQPQPLAQHQQPGQTNTKQPNAPQQPGQPPTAPGQTNIPGQKVATGEPQPSVKLFSLGEKSQTPPEQLSLPTEATAMLRVLESKATPTAVPVPLPSGTLLGRLSRARNESSRGSERSEGSSREGVSLDRGLALGMRRQMRDMPC